MQDPDTRETRRLRAKVTLAVVVGAMLLVLALLVYIFGERVTSVLPAAPLGQPTTPS